MAYRERFERELAELGLGEQDTGSTARDVVVGERVVLDVKDTPYSDYEVVKVAWIIPDTVVKGYSATRKKTTLERLTPSDREKSRVVFFWVDAGKRDVGLNITFKTGGVQKTGNATVAFNVVAPKLDHFKDTGSSPRIIKNGALRGVRFGEIKKDHGVHWDWKVTLPAKYGGAIKDVQTIRQGREKSVKKGDTDVAADETVEDGTITKGKRATKPVLEVAVDPAFSAFATVGSIDSMVEQDTIILQLPDSPSTAEWVQQIALGTARAFQWVTRKNRSDDANVNILNALKRDMMALQDADIIVSQAFASKELKGQKKPPPMEGLPDNFHRAMYGSQFRHTGLEHHVLNEFATQEIIRKKLRRSEIKAFKIAADALDIKARDLVDYLSDPSPLFVTTSGGSAVPLDSKYAEQRAVLRVIDARWKALGDKAELKEISEMLEDHQAAFFQGVIRYRPMKSTTGTP